MTKDRSHTRSWGGSLAFIAISSQRKFGQIQKKLFDLFSRQLRDNFLTTEAPEKRNQRMGRGGGESKREAALVHCFDPRSTGCLPLNKRQRGKGGFLPTAVTVQFTLFSVIFASPPPVNFCVTPWLDIPARL